MSNSFKTEQEDFWAGKFGNNYIDRNKGNHIIAQNLSLFSSIFKNTDSIKSVIEFGANIGLNLKAIQALLPDVKLSAIEINSDAVDILKKSLDVNVYCQSILDFKNEVQYDFVLSKGVLIHINPDELSSVYNKLYDSSSNYICIAEYYNPSPVMIEYRGHKNRLFKRDFAGEMLNTFKDLTLIDYGFVYHKDKVFPLDDITWFLLKKR